MGQSSVADRRSLVTRLNITLQDSPSEPLALNESDDALLASFRAGQTTEDRSSVDAFTTLYERHNRRLFFYALKLVGDAQVAEDLTQTMWEKVIDLRSDSTIVRNAVGFFVRVLRNLALDHIKRRRFQTPLEAARELRSDESKELTEREELVLQSLNALRLESKEILILHYYSGYSFEEIARMLGKKTNAIWTRASRARSEMRTEMEKRLRHIEKVDSR